MIFVARRNLALLSHQLAPDFEQLRFRDKVVTQQMLNCGEREDEDGRWGTAWLYDGDHNWEIEDDHVCIIAPVKIDLVDANGYGDTAVLEENVEPYDE